MSTNLDRTTEETSPDELLRRIIANNSNHTTQSEAAPERGPSPHEGGRPQPLRGPLSPTPGTLSLVHQQPPIVNVSSRNPPPSSLSNNLNNVSHSSAATASFVHYSPQPELATPQAFPLPAVIADDDDNGDEGDNIDSASSGDDDDDSGGHHHPHGTATSSPLAHLGVGGLELPRHHPLLEDSTNNSRRAHPQLNTSGTASCTTAAGRPKPQLWSPAVQPLFHQGQHDHPRLTNLSHADDDQPPLSPSTDAGHWPTSQQQTRLPSYQSVLQQGPHQGFALQRPNSSATTHVQPPSPSAVAAERDFATLHQPSARLNSSGLSLSSCRPAKEDYQPRESATAFPMHAGSFDAPSEDHNAIRGRSLLNERRSSLTGPSPTAIINVFHQPPGTPPAQQLQHHHQHHHTTIPDRMDESCSEDEEDDEEEGDREVLAPEGGVDANNGRNASSERHQGATSQAVGALSQSRASDGHNFYHSLSNDLVEVGGQQQEPNIVLIGDRRTEAMRNRRAATEQRDGRRRKRRRFVGSDDYSDSDLEMPTQLRRIVGAGSLINKHMPVPFTKRLPTEVTRFIIDHFLPVHCHYRLRLVNRYFNLLITSNCCLWMRRVPLYLVQLFTTTVCCHLLDHRVLATESPSTTAQLLEPIDPENLANNQAVAAEAQRFTALRVKAPPNVFCFQGCAYRTWRAQRLAKTLRLLRRFHRQKKKYIGGVIGFEILFPPSAGAGTLLSVCATSLFLVTFALLIGKHFDSILFYDTILFVFIPLWIGMTTSLFAAYSFISLTDAVGKLVAVLFGIAVCGSPVILYFMKWTHPPKRSLVTLQVQSWDNDFHISALDDRTAPALIMDALKTTTSAPLAQSMEDLEKDGTQHLLYLLPVFIALLTWLASSILVATAAISAIRETLMCYKEVDDACCDVQIVKKVRRRQPVIENVKGSSQNNGSSGAAHAFPPLRLRRSQSPNTARNDDDNDGDSAGSDDDQDASRGGSHGGGAFVVDEGGAAGESGDPNNRTMTTQFAESTDAAAAAAANDAQASPFSNQTPSVWSRQANAAAHNTDDTRESVIATRHPKELPTHGPQGEYDSWQYILFCLMPPLTIFLFLLAGIFLAVEEDARTPRSWYDRQAVLFPSVGNVSLRGTPRPEGIFVYQSSEPPAGGSSTTSSGSVTTAAISYGELSIDGLKFDPKSRGARQPIANRSLLFRVQVSGFVDGNPSACGDVSKRALLEHPGTTPASTLLPLNQVLPASALCCQRPTGIRWSLILIALAIGVFQARLGLGLASAWRKVARRIPVLTFVFAMLFVATLFANAFLLSLAVQHHNEILDADSALSWRWVLDDLEPDKWNKGRISPPPSATTSSPAGISTDPDVKGLFVSASCEHPIVISTVSSVLLCLFVIFLAISLGINVAHHKERYFEWKFVKYKTYFERQASAFNERLGGGLSPHSSLNFGQAIGGGAAQGNAAMHPPAALGGDHHISAWVRGGNGGQSTDVLGRRRAYELPVTPRQR